GNLRAEYADYSQLAKYLGKQDPWDRLVHLWLAAIPDGGRWSISGLLLVQRTGEGMHLALRQHFDTSIAASSTRAFNALSLSIADELRQEIESSFETSFASAGHQLRSHFGALRSHLDRAVDLSELRDDANLRRVEAEFDLVEQLLSHLRDIGRVTSHRSLD